MLARRTEGGTGGRPILLAPHSKHLRRLFWVVSLPTPPQPHTHIHTIPFHQSLPAATLPLSIYNFPLAPGVTGGYFLTQGSFRTLIQCVKLTAETRRQGPSLAERSGRLCQMSFASASVRNWLILSDKQHDCWGKSRS